MQIIMSTSYRETEKVQTKLSQDSSKEKADMLLTETDPLKGQTISSSTKVKRKQV